MHIVVCQELGWVLSDALFLGSVYFFYFWGGVFSVFFFVDDDFVALLCIVMWSVIITPMVGSNRDVSLVVLAVIVSLVVHFGGAANLDIPPIVVLDESEILPHHRLTHFLTAVTRCFFGGLDWSLIRFCFLFNSACLGLEKCLCRGVDLRTNPNVKLKQWHGMAEEGYSSLRGVLKLILWYNSW